MGRGSFPFSTAGGHTRKFVGIAFVIFEAAEEGIEREGLFCQLAAGEMGYPGQR